MYSVPHIWTQSPPVSNKDLQPPAVGGFSFARRISPFLGLYAAFSFALYPTIPAAFTRFTGLYSRPTMRTFQQDIAQKYTYNKAPIIFSKKFFLILLQTCFPTGYKRRTAQQQTPHDKTPPHNSDTGTRHNNKRRKNSKRKFSKLVTNAVPHGVTTETPHNSGGNKFNSTGQNGTDA